MRLLQAISVFAADMKIDSPNIPKVNLDAAQVSNIFNGVLWLAGAVAVIFVIWGGLKYTLSNGDSSETQKAKNTILYAIIGLVVVIVSFVIVRTVQTLIFGR